MAKDLYNENVKIALQKDEWVITDDPYYLMVLDSTTYEIDLGAERLIAAEKGVDRIAVEVKSFLNASIPHDFHKALGQYISYQTFMEEIESEADRKLYLAVPLKVFDVFFTKASTQLLLSKFHVNVIVFNQNTNLIELWLEN